ncbi:enoyl-CoA hydratase/isomerase family protein [Rhodococcus koreensis]
MPVVQREFVEDGVLLVTLNRPDRKNAITPELRREFAVAMDSATADRDVRVVAVTGAGDAFCAGADLKEPDDGGSAASMIEVEARMKQFHREFAGALYSVPKPTVALVNGPAAGGGMGLALAADFRIAGASAAFVSAFARIALPGDNGVTYGLQRLLGRARALEILMLSPRIGADEAFGMGMVRGVVPDDQLREEGLAFCRRLAAGPAAAFALMKANLAFTEIAGYAASTDREAAGIAVSSTTGETEEAVRAFLERREPRFA